MRTLSRAALLLQPFLLLLVLGCGKEIGDECFSAADCSPNGDRQCVEGHCTVQGCDYNTCPDEATCVQFFIGGFSNQVCDPALEDLSPGNDACSLDELCPLLGHCVPRSSESRFCMRKCDSDGDCPDKFECRDLELMRSHGGQPVPAPGTRIGDDPQRFCAPAGA